ncbi:calcium-binding protein P-like [Mytilus californianus]|uniref:calcium-binding protein P-like n=1 Tax=Mytilus californianus TaxID=6549 RepID=UPI002245ED0C|nr:calcium-binding protein P-like [Mytilus californianus]
MLPIFVFTLCIYGFNAQQFNQGGGFPNQQFGQQGQFPGQQFGQQGQFQNQQFGQQGQFPGQQFGQQGIIGQNGFQNQIPGQFPGQQGFNGVNNFAQNQQFIQQSVGNPNSCHVRGCGIGQQCVYRSNVGLPYICPTWIPVLPCQCIPGCRAQNQFIQVGQTKQIDTCGNRCTCNTQNGQASCTQIACNQASPGTQPQTIGTIPGVVPGVVQGGIPGAIGGVPGQVGGILPGGIQGGPQVPIGKKK